MNYKIKVRIFGILMLLVFTFNFSCVFASYENSNISLGKYRIYYNKNENRYIKYNGVSQRFFDYYYIDDEGNRCPAYCINLGVDGAEKEEYEVEVKQKLEDEKLTSIILNGYPYKTLNELGLNSNEEAKFATQFAVWTYLSKLDFNKIEPLNSSNQNVVNAIKKIYTNGVNNKIEDNSLNIEEIDKDFNIDNINKEYYSKRIRLIYNENVKEIILSNLSQDIKICDLNNNFLDKVTNQKEIKLMVKRDKIIQDSNITFSFLYNTKENSVMFGSAVKTGMQNVAITLKPLKNVVKDLNLKLKYIPNMLKIIKVDKDDNNIKIPNVKFRIYNADESKILGEYITDKNGEVLIDLQKDFNILIDSDVVIEEVEVPEEYYIDKSNNKQKVSLKIGQENKIIFENKKIRGNVKIIKTSNEDNKLSGLKKGSPIEGTVFNIFDETGNIVDTITTDKDGIAYSKILPKGKYYIKEVKTNKFYVINSTSFEFEIKKPNEEICINIGNDNIEYTEELPLTGNFN